MANEVTSTTVEEIIGSEWIQPMFHEYARPHVVATQHLLTQSLAGKGTATWSVPSIVSRMGTPSDGGTSVDTEFNATEATDLSNTVMETTQVSISVGEYGIMRTITDEALEQTIDGFLLTQQIAADNARILTTALEDDVCALFANFSTVVGTSGSDMTLGHLDDAITAIRTAGVRAMKLVAVLDDEQVDNLETAITAAASTQATYGATADRYMGIQRDAGNGLMSGRAFTYKGIDVFGTGLCDTANTAEDVVGAVFVPAIGDLANDLMAALGMAKQRDLRMETERNASLRATELVTTMSAGVGELLDAAGVAVITDAPA